MAYASQMMRGIVATALAGLLVRLPTTGAEPAAPADATVPASRVASPDPTETQAFKIFMPVVRIGGSSIEEALEYLNSWSRSIEDPSPGSVHRINIVLIDNASAHRISLDVRDISMGKVLGMFATQAGLTVTYRDDAALVHKPGHLPHIAAMDAPQIQRAKAIVLPEVKLFDPTPAEAAEFLIEKSKKFDPAHHGFNVVINPGVKTMHQVNLDLRKIPLSEVACYIAMIAGLELKVDDKTLTFSPQ